MSRPGWERRRRRGAPITTSAMILALAAGPAAAQDDEDGLPTGRFGAVTAFRQNVGELGSSYGLGFLFGLEAGYQPGADRELSIGINWSVLFRGWYFADDASLVEQSINAAEMSLGLRLQRSLSRRVPRYLVLSGGATLLRTSIPVPPDDERLYLGPYAGIGIEQYVLRSGFVGVEARYGLIAGGPGSMSILLRFVGGS